MVYTTHLFWFWGWFIVVLGVDAVKGPCAVSIFSVLCVLLVIVIVNRVGGGVNGGDVNVLCTFTHTSLLVSLSHSHICYATLLLVSLAHSHIRRATLLLVSLAHSHTRRATLLLVSLAHSHIRYATLLLVSLAHSHIRRATLLLGFSCTSTHTSCDATARFLLHIHTYVMLRYC